MFSPSEGPQQSAPTAVTLAAAAPAAEAVMGTRVVPRCVIEGCGGSTRIASGRGVGGGTCSSAGDRWYCFPHCVGGGGGQGARFCRSGIDGGPATGGTVSFAASVEGAPASSAVAAASAEISAAEPATSRNVTSAASARGAVGACESSAGAVPTGAATEAAPSTDGIAAPAASTAREARALASAVGSDGEICGEMGAFTHPFDPGTVCPLEVHYYYGSWLQHGSSSGSSSSSSSNDNTSDHDSW